MDASTLKVLIIVGVALGCLGGLAGGVIGTYCSIRNAKGPRERGFVIRASLTCWLAVLLFLAGLLLLPRPWNMLLWIPYVPLLLIGIRSWNRRQMQIQQEEANQASEPGAPRGRQ
jgi:hypothetical protein